MERKYLALNSALLFWLLSLAAWCFDATHLTWPAAAISLLAFSIHFLLIKVNPMFKKNKTGESSHNAINEPPSFKGAGPSGAQARAITWIAQDVTFVGNITASGDMAIYGTLHGNIDAKESRIEVKQGATVEGDIACRELIIDGNVIGQCTSDTIKIDENGIITGKLIYRDLAVKKGGIFSGNAEALPPVEEKNNVIGMKKDAATQSVVADKTQKA